MKKIRVNFIFRKRGPGHNSIEELFQSIIAHLPEEIDARVVELPYAGASVKAVLGNLWHVLFLRGIIHVTGDVYYIGLIPFKKIIITLHDANVLQLDNLSGLKKMLIKWIWYTLPLIMVKKITVISDFTKSQVKDLYKDALKKTKVIHNPVNATLKAQHKHLLSQPPLVLHIGTKPHKNLEHTIQAVHYCKYQLVIVGKLNDSQMSTLKRYSIDYKNYNDITFSGIKGLYEACDMVSFVSYLEGFGMPIIEAQKVGRPVVTSNRCSLPEIGGEGAIYVNPDDVNAIARAYRKLVEDIKFRTQLIELGFKNVKRFDVGTISSEYYKLYIEF